MGKLTEEVFNPSCCDGGAGGTMMSAQPCGCDRGAGWTCQEHAKDRIGMRGPHGHQGVEGVDGIPAPNAALQKLAKEIQKEVRVVDPKTGGEKGSKLARFSLIPPEALWALAEHYGKGEKKYAARNWEKGYAWGLTVDSLLRHVFLFWLGERYDNHRPDCPKDCLEHTESHHLIAAAWHCIALFIFDIRGIGTDDVTRKEGT